MKSTKIQKGLLLASIACGVLAVGCELIVDFDRTRIPSELAEASVPDANLAEASVPARDGGDAGDASTDASTDAPGSDDAGDGGDADAS